MPEEATTLDPVALVRLALEAANSRDLDAVASLFASDAAFEGQVGNLRGRAEIRSFLEDWFGAYEELEFKLEDVRSLGNGVVFAVVVQEGVPAGSAGHGHFRLCEGWVFLWERGLIARRSAFDEIDEARAAAERLAESRGKAVPEENLEIVRCLIAALNARDLEGYLACCTEDVELHTPLEPFVGVYQRREGIRQWLVDVEDSAPDFHIDLMDVKAIGDQVLAFAHFNSSGRASGIPTTGEITNAYDLIDGKVKRVRVFADRSEALKAVGLEA